jgi:hypothetical protein
VPSSPLFAFSGANLETIFALLPEDHAGFIVLTPPSPLSHKPTIGAWARWFTKAGIQTRQVLEKFLILAPDQAARMFNRIGGDNAFIGDYMVLNCTNEQDAEREIVDHVAKAQSEEGIDSSHCIRLFFRNGAIGMFSGDQRPVVFEAWINQRLRRLYGGKTPPEIPAANFAGLFNVDPTNGAYDMLIERRKTGPRIWLRSAQDANAQLAECTRGRWLVTQSLNVPRILKSNWTRRLLTRHPMTVKKPMSPIASLS